MNQVFSTATLSVTRVHHRKIHLRACVHHLWPHHRTQRGSLLDVDSRLSDGPEASECLLPRWVPYSSGAAVPSGHERSMLQGFHPEPALFFWTIFSLLCMTHAGETLAVFSWSFPPCASKCIISKFAQSNKSNCKRFERHLSPNVDNHGVNITCYLTSLNVTSGA